MARLASSYVVDVRWFSALMFAMFLPAVPAEPSV